MARKALASAIRGSDIGVKTQLQTQQLTKLPASSQLLYHDTDIGQQCYSICKSADYLCQVFYALIRPNPLEWSSLL